MEENLTGFGNYISEIKKSIKRRQLLGIKYHYADVPLFYYPLGVSKDFFLGAEEYMFDIDGYQIRRHEDIVGVEEVNDFTAKINIEEGLVDKLIDYKINLTSFETIFTDLYNMDEYISVEREYEDEDEFFLVGRIVKVTEFSIWFENFTNEGIWNSEINIIPYDIITTIRFNNKYINTWKKYIKKDDKNED